MNSNDALNLAVLAGQIILENGGETYRTEETIERILENKVDSVETFVTPTGIFTSIDKDGITTSTIKRIKARTIDLNKVALVNDLARKLSCMDVESIDFDLYKRELANIRSKRKYSFIIRLFAAGMAAAASGMTIGSRTVDFIPTFITAMFLQAFITLLEKLNFSIFIIDILGGGFAAICGIVFSQLGIGALDRIIIGSIMTLLPGVAITNAVRDTISGDLLSGISRGVEALMVVIGIAIGVGAILNLWIILGGIL